jgi:hypothetical protein
MFSLKNASKNDISIIFTEPESLEGIKEIESLKLLLKKWYINEKTYNIFKYDKTVLLHDMILKTGLFRSIITDKKGKILCFSPPKSLHMEKFVQLYDPEDCIAENFVEGTMINLFFDSGSKEEEGEWEIATKSTVGGKVSYFMQNSTTKEEEEEEKKSKNVTFRQMFLEACNHVNLEFDMLNKEYSYSFVLQHPNNRIVGVISEIALYLVEVYQIDNDELSIKQIDREEYMEKLKKETTISFPEQYPMTNNYSEIVDKYASMNTPYDIMGVMFKHKESGIHSKMRNPNYEDIKMLRGNQPKLQYTYYALRKEGKVKNYLKYFSEAKPEFNVFRDQLHRYTSSLHQNYMDCYVFKKKPLGEFPFQYKKHMYALHHNHFLEHLREDGEKVTFPYVISYINNLHPAQLMFTINHNMRKQFIESKKEEYERELE